MFGLGEQSDGCVIGTKKRGGGGSVCVVIQGRTSMPTESSSCFLDFVVVGDLGSVVLDRIDVSPGGRFSRHGW